MKQGTMKILFFVFKTKLLKNGEAPILMRITINGQYEETRIHFSNLFFTLKTLITHFKVHYRTRGADISNIETRNRTIQPR